MSHRHYCDYAGHDWQCDKTVCVCFDHDVPMEDGDHSQCTIELRACPEHREAQLREMGLVPGVDNMPQFEGAAEATTFKDKDGRPIAGFCIWCGHRYYQWSYEAQDAHLSKCAAFQAAKSDG